MKVIAIVAALVAAVAASDFPACAIQCAMEAGKAAGCSPGDIKCFCSSADALNAAKACLPTRCTPEETKAAMAGALKLCGPYMGSVPEEHKKADAPAPAPAPAAPAAEPKSAPAAPAPAAHAPSQAATTECSTQTSCSTRTLPSKTMASHPAVFTGAAATAGHGGAALAMLGVAAALAL